MSYKEKGIAVQIETGRDLAEYLLDHPKQRSILMTKQMIDTIFKDEKPFMWYEPGVPEECWYVLASSVIEIFMPERSEQ